MTERIVLRYGENSHQDAEWTRDPDISLTQHQGKELSYTNILDLISAVRIALEFGEPAAAWVKHMNPCGVAISEDIEDACKIARYADPVSAFGGIVGLNRRLTQLTAVELMSGFVECVIAPSVDPNALAILVSKPNIRVVTANYSFIQVNTKMKREEITTVLGKLSQQRDWVSEAMSPWPNDDYPKVVTERQPTENEWRALRFAWRVCAYVKSNAVVLTDDRRTWGIGGGQSNRVASAKIATGALLPEPPKFPKLLVAASDAFFPFRDGLDVVADAGVTAVAQPGGSTRDQEVIDAANEHGMAMVFTNRRHFRH